MIVLKNGEVYQSRKEKAERAVGLARLMLGSDASEQDVEDQAVALMFVPDEELASMRERLIRYPRDRVDSLENR